MTIKVKYDVNNVSLSLFFKKKILKNYCKGGQGWIFF